MAARIKFNNKTDSWLAELNESQFARFADFVGQEIEIINAFTYIGKEGTKTAGKEGFTAMFKDRNGKIWYSTSFGNVVVKQGKEIIASMNELKDSIVVIVGKKVSKSSGSEYIFFQ